MGFLKKNPKAVRPFLQAFGEVPKVQKYPIIKIYQIKIVPDQKGILLFELATNFS